MIGEELRPNTADAAVLRAEASGEEAAVLS